MCVSPAKNRTCYGVEPVHIHHNYDINHYSDVYGNDCTNNSLKYVDFLIFKHSLIDKWFCLYYNYFVTKASLMVQNVKIRDIAVIIYYCSDYL
jgi:hypothetical protein